MSIKGEHWQVQGSTAQPIDTAIKDAGEAESACENVCIEYGSVWNDRRYTGHCCEPVRHAAWSRVEMYRACGYKCVVNFAKNHACFQHGKTVPVQHT